MNTIETRLFACFRVTLVLVCCPIMLGLEARIFPSIEPEVGEQQQDIRFPWTVAASQVNGHQSSPDSWLRGADLQSQRVRSMKELIEFISSLTRSGSFRSVKKVHVYTKDSLGTGHPSAIISLREQDLPEPMDRKSDLVQLSERATEAKASSETQPKGRPERKEESQLSTNSKAPVGAKAKAAAGHHKSDGTHSLSRLSSSEPGVPRQDEVQNKKEKTDLRPASRLVVKEEDNRLDGQREDHQVASSQRAETKEDNPKDEHAKPVVGVDTLLAKLDLVDRLLARLQAIKRRNATLTDYARGEDPDSSYGFDLSDSELDEPEQKHDEVEVDISLPKVSSQFRNDHE